MMILRKPLWILPLFLLASLTGCVTSHFQSEGQQRISIMSYNVENLFDTLDDPGKNDETYLPIGKKKDPKIQEKCNKITFARYRKQCLNLNWSKSTLNKKMQRLADVILQVNNGYGPDILVLQEVENKRVLELLRKRYLKKAQYKEAILIEGPDKRGIDVGIFSRLIPSKIPRLHHVKWKKGSARNGEDPKPSRGILEANFILPDNTPLNIYGVHFPSQYNPYSVRKQAIAKLNALAKSKPAHHVTIAAGDFNVSSEENKAKQVYSKTLSPQWLISHYLGCKKCSGTYYYRKNNTWSFFDLILFSKNLSPNTTSSNQSSILPSSWRVDVSSIRTPKDSLFQVSRFLTPAYFKEGRAPRGVSDHWPIYVEILLRNPNTIISKPVNPPVGTTH